jgi:hypothetical protein
MVFSRQDFLADDDGQFEQEAGATGVGSPDEVSPERGGHP